jgi:hypothetical protein
VSAYCQCGAIRGLHLIYECRLKAVDKFWWKVWGRPCDPGRVSDPVTPYGNITGSGPTLTHE